MKKTLLISIIIGSSVFCYSVFSQNNQPTGTLGLPGDNLNLYGVLSLFQSSATLEEFEQKLNAEDSKINNLDLDGDGKTDYIKVFDNVNGNAHAIVLQDVVNEKESQDVAVREVEKDKNNQIQIQVIGDEQLYGKDYIIEPANNTPNPGYSGNENTNGANEGKTTVVNNNYYNTTNYAGNGAGVAYAVGTWSIIHFIFAPSYVMYISPFRWGFYPTYWHPWHPIFYNDYYGHWHNHPSYGYYHQAHAYRAPIAHSYYAPRRTTSVIVHQRIVERHENNNNHNRVVSPEHNMRQMNNKQPIRDNRQAPPRPSPAARPTAHDNNNMHATPSAHPAPRSVQKPAAKPAQKQNARPEPKQNNRAERKSEER